MRQAKQKQQHKQKLLKQVAVAKTKETKKIAMAMYHVYCRASKK